MRLPARVVSTLLVLVTLAPVRAQVPTALDALLALPPSPGVEALLLAHVADARVPARWREALSDVSAPRRAAAARMIGIAGVRSALGGLMHAVSNERDPVVLTEALRALAIIGSEQADQAIYARLSAAPGLPEARIAAVLTTLRPGSVVTHVLAGGRLAQTSARVSEIHSRLLEVSPVPVRRRHEAPVPSRSPHGQSRHHERSRTGSRSIPTARSRRASRGSSHSDARPGGDPRRFDLARCTSDARWAGGARSDDCHGQLHTLM